LLVLYHSHLDNVSYAPAFLGENETFTKED